jgi:uncharacterized repeat protein (TIGR03803 family)
MRVTYLFNRWKLVPVALGLLSCAAAATAQTKFLTLHTFISGTDGRAPWGQLYEDTAGNLYGTTVSGGTSGLGTVFEVSPSGNSWKEAVLHSFAKASGTDYEGPEANLVMDGAGDLYGTTLYGGSRGAGMVFELTPPVLPGESWSETILYEFDGSLGAYPGGVLLGEDGALYGTTLWGNTAYQIKPPSGSGGSWTGAGLFKFNAGSDGNGPFYQGGALIADGKGNVYGTTYLGGAYGGGEVFELSPPETGNGDWKETVLYSFGGYAGDGLSPTGALVADASGNLYGTAQSGGASQLGAVFELAPPARQGDPWTETLLHSFAGGGDGELPYAGLVIDKGGSLYGVSYLGGTGTCYSPDYTGCGTIFKVSLTGDGSWATSILHSFQGASDGQFPYGGLIIDGDGHLFGTTSAGGKYGNGTVFEVKP